MLLVCLAHFGAVKVATVCKRIELTVCRPAFRCGRWVLGREEGRVGCEEERGICWNKRLALICA